MPGDPPRIATNVTLLADVPAVHGPFVLLFSRRLSCFIKLTRRAVEALKRHRARQLEERLAAGSLWHDHDLIFCTRVGSPLPFSRFRERYFKPLLERANLPNIRFHDLRHTCATLLLSRGHHPKLVQELLGHTSVAITLDRYSHVMPGMGDQTAAAMEAALS